MRRKKNTDLYAVQDTKDVTEAVIDRVLAELREEDGIQENIEEQVRQHKRSRRIRVTVISTLVIMIAVTSFLVIHLQTYMSSRTITTYENNSDGNVNYRQFADGVLKYSKDGIALLNRRGKENWNQPYQIKNPIIDTYNNDAVVVADKGGITMLVLDREGLKGEIQTMLPVEKAVVSAQGIVCTVLKNGTSPKIVCYDAAGNLFIKMTASLSGTGDTL